MKNSGIKYRLGDCVKAVASVRDYFPFKIWENNHLRHSGLGYFKHLYLGIYLSFLALSVFVIGIIHSFVPNFLPFLPIAIVNKIKEIFNFNYQQQPDNKKQYYE